VVWEEGSREASPYPDWEGWKTWFWFSRLSTGRHFHITRSIADRQFDSLSFGYRRFLTTTALAIGRLSNLPGATTIKRTVGLSYTPQLSSLDRCTSFTCGG